MKRTPETDRRTQRSSLGCAHLELAGVELAMPVVGRDGSTAGRPARLRNLFAPRGSAVV